ncbi:MAG: universal stress protein UspA, partial [Deinococcus sp.]|nr:universal stress protein UspA [Deinococcus sp.]
NSSRAAFDSQGWLSSRYSRLFYLACCYYLTKVNYCHKVELVTDLPPPSSGLYQDILVATGGAPHSRTAVERAVQFALRDGATLHIVTVVPQTTSPLAVMAAAFPGSESLDVQVRQDETARRQAHLTHTAQQIRAQGLTVVEHLVPALRPADAILEVARQTSVHLIVLGRKHTTAWSAALSGSVSDAVSHASPVDVLIAR